jgi:hypothetical protein
MSAGSKAPTVWQSGINEKEQVVDAYDKQDTEVVNSRPVIEEDTNPAKTDYALKPPTGGEGLKVKTGDPIGLKPTKSDIIDGELSNSTTALGAFRSLSTKAQDLITKTTGFSLIGSKVGNVKTKIKGANLKSIKGLATLIRGVSGGEYKAVFKDITGLKSLGKGIIKQTHAQIIEKYTEMSKMFPDVRDEVQQVYASGEKHIVVEFISKGTAPDGSKFELPICTIFTIENGKITKDFTYYDNSN